MTTANTDGPFVESKEYLGGSHAKVEVRPFL
jgi:hypothetical protein